MDLAQGAGVSTATTSNSNGSYNGTTAASSDTVAPRSKVNSACEACRLAKVKCQPSDRSGVCRRCLEFRRECVFRTGPRTRRPRQSRLNHTAPRRPPPAGPSQTFSINFDMPAPDNACPAALESLAHRHASYIDSLLPPDDTHIHTPMFDDLMFNALHSFHHPGGFAPSPPRSHTSSSHSNDRPPSNTNSDYHSHAHLSPSGTSSSSSRDAAAGTPGPSLGNSTAVPSTVSISSIGLKPQFNLDSASRLLDCFRQMVPHFPCIVLPPGATVQSLAKSRPFVLLAILSVASGAGSLQGHTLYDDEFRKILGLKFVACGERSVELLQGLLIYCAWYPFHLRPKNKQAFQYVRMAAEIAHDLDLVQPPAETIVTADSPVTPEQIDGMRTYLSCYYLVSSFVATWAKFSALGLEYTQWTSICCGVLERRSDVEGDSTLSWLVRCAHIIEETCKLDRPGPDVDDKKSRFMLLGLESQFREWCSRIPSTSMPSGSALHIMTGFTELYLYASPLLRLGKPKKAQPGLCGAPLEIDPDRLFHALPILRRLLDAFAALPSSALIPLTSIDWGKFVQVTILGLRLSMPLPGCPAWDDAFARQQLRFGVFLGRFSQGDGRETKGLMPPGVATTGTNVVAASRIVFGVVRQKYEGRLAKLGQNKPAPKSALDVQSQPQPDTSSAAQDLAMTIPTATRLRGCPMLDGSLDGYIPMWDQDLEAPPMLSGLLSWENLEGGLDAGGLSGMDAGDTLLQDMWTTTGWPQGEEMSSRPSDPRDPDRI
ncbi:hypothetical protein SODALDRAFT_329536 [Sodiomyces alkalinus F11]|uniref:Zn(2)-C6 fungal-type domain-containing protein n=1 Tax=Sodiomyces alkalinus (strain CBS 110278 / VKM F-3762 / F11) TaxID=1314773 RepID=A0A3N2PJW5_SODAK|nr:hypothetical protein SODALDRAFT_329536 [Sodiomyces alkalinus F11]ROT34674.1 hypothetical protein SODALDRAFT_329536 [Sodiomyces alkalinus F11]